MKKAARTPKHQPSVPPALADRSWFGAARRHAEGKGHDWPAIQRIIGKAMAGEDESRQARLEGAERL